MAKQTLTTKIVEDLDRKPVTKDSLTGDAKQPGLYVRKAPTMTGASYIYRREVTRGGKRRLVTDSLGPVKNHSLEDARRWARDRSAALDRGEDPAAKRQEKARQEAET